MLKNLQPQIDSNVVRNFDFGSIDAWDDQLLHSCFCEIEPVDEFLRGSKELLVGAKGAGKSAVFRLVSEGKIHFNNPRRLKQIIVPVNEVMEYTAIRRLVNDRIGGNIANEDNELFFFWEIYILYRILRELKSGYQRIFGRLGGDAERFLKHFEDDKPGFIDFLKGIKGTAGVKFDISNPNLPVPDFYVSAEKAEANGKIIADLPLLKIDSIKSDICKQLSNFKSVLYMLVDNLDDFASREEFDAQKQVIQGLVEVCRYYTKFPEIKIKAALRPELYEKLNFAKLGGRDKIEPRTVHILWKNDDIRRFIGERLLVNISRLCVKKGKHIQILVRENELFRPHRQKKGLIAGIIWRVKDFFAQERDIRDARTIDLKDRLYRYVITAVFPREVKHFNSAGKLIDRLDIFEYFASHFCFAGNTATPRIYLRFLSKVFSVASDRYSKNEPGPIKLDENGEYPLIKRDFLLEAYSKLQKEARDNCISSIDYGPWKNNLSLLFEKQGKKTSVTYGTLRKWVGQPEDAAMREFLAYCRHLGVLHCDNKNGPLEQRTYHFPILFQKIWSQQNTDKFV